jgi:hypothetical protein
MCRYDIQPPCATARAIGLRWDIHLLEQIARRPGLDLLEHDTLVYDNDVPGRAPMRICLR